MAKTVTFFALNSPDGKKLQTMLTQIFEHKYQWKVEIDKTVWDFMKACNHDDVVILDATIEKDGLSNYSRVSLHSQMNNVLVVSRTYLPMNYVTLHKGGTHQYPYPYAELDDTDPYITCDGTHSNETLVKWLKEKIPTIPERPSSQRGFIGSLKTASISADEYIQHRKNTCQIFMSYRSKGVKELGYEPVRGTSVRPDDLDLRGTGRLVKNLVKLKRNIGMGMYHHGVRKNAYFVMPGVLAYPGEVLTLFRRWQVLTGIEAWISSAEEFWIYDTEAYLDSWWTQGELVLWAFLRKKNRAPRLRVYDYRSDTLKDPPLSYIPTLTQKQFHIVDRLCANTDPSTMPADGAEEVFRILANLPLLDKVSYFKDPIWNKSFWTYPLLQCQCNTLAASSKVFDVESFLTTSDPSITPEEMAEAVQRGELKCPNPTCGRRYKINELPPRYRWSPAKSGKFAKAGENVLDVYPTYRAWSSKNL